MKNSLFIIVAALFMTTACTDLEDIPTPINESPSESSFQEYGGLQNPRSASELKKVSHAKHQIQQAATSREFKVASKAVHSFQYEEKNDRGMVVFHQYFLEWQELYATLYHKNYIGQKMSLEEFLTTNEVIEMDFAEWIVLQQTSLKYYNERAKYEDRANGNPTLSLNDWIDHQIISVKSEISLRIEGTSKSDPKISFGQFWKAKIKRFKP